MASRDLFESLRQAFAQPEPSPWKIGHELLQRKTELEQSGTSQGCKTLDEIIASQGLRRTVGRQWLQIVQRLDEKQYGHLPPAKLRYLAQLDREEERQRFRAQHDIEALSVRELRAAVKRFRSQPASPGNGVAPPTAPASAEKPDERSGSPGIGDEASLASLLELMRQHTCLGMQMTQIIEKLLDQGNPAQPMRKEVVKEQQPQDQTQKPEEESNDGEGIR